MTTSKSPSPEKSAARLSRPKVVRTIRELRRRIAAFRADGDTIALVPTMGALHDGHLTLARTAARKAKRVVVSIFVNPTQFAPTEDLSRYPRDETGDLDKLASVGVDLVWAPTVEEMYGPYFATRVEVAGAAEGLEGAFRPQHFGGVATVCTKLFSQVTPDVALFGEKDYQQLCVIRQTVRDLNLPLDIHGVATVREKDGLALSSRNAYLSEDERRIAPALNAALRDVAAKIVAGGRPSAACKSAIIALKKVADAETLSEWKPSSGRRARVLAAAWLGRTRLIDNVPVEAATARR